MASYLEGDANIHSYSPLDGGYEHTWRARDDTTEAVLHEIEPFRRHLEELDAARLRLEQEGGTLRDVGALVMLLEKKLPITVDGRDYRISLDD
jgi:hypothetical protein